jgi:16S rRNA C967 or C1407 C5-methylase (RsmB/RsmF family)/NOL1/NOP2/fmu family ribosome biogenesis protein
MQVPVSLIHSLEGIDGFDRHAFEQTHADGEAITSIRINPAKPAALFGHAVNELKRVPWSRYGFYLPQRPSFTFDPLFHAGCYYVQEASSMFLEKAFEKIPGKEGPLKVLDLSAAPGGKSTHLQSLLPEGSLLVSNEVIKSRASILRDNMIRWGSANVMVTNNDPAHFQALEGFFDLIVVDAPCSGSGLFRREPEAISEWSENAVQLCSQRQQRILADVWPALREGGILVYSTCSFSSEEDEEILDWMHHEWQVKGIALDVPEDSGIVTTLSKAGLPGYRFWPHKVKGEGFFLAMVEKQDGVQGFAGKLRKKPDTVTKAEQKLLDPWIDMQAMTTVRHQQTVYAWPASIAGEWAILLEKMRVVYSGVRLGELMRDKLVPDHALALSGLLRPAVPATSLDLEQSILYLQRRDFTPDTAGKGWQTVNFRGYPLGWINALPNRINNYYPRELRILKDSPGS